MLRFAVNAPREAAIASERDNEISRHPLLATLGERVRTLRARRGMTRKAVAQAANVSERHLANLEYGTGNASILVLQQIAVALQCPVAELIGDVTTSSPEWLLIRELLERRDDIDLRRARVALSEMFDARNRSDAATDCLVGLSGAGVSARADARRPISGCLRRAFAVDRAPRGMHLSEYPCAVRHNAYRRYERRGLEEANPHHRSGHARPGLVSDPSDVQHAALPLLPPSGCSEPGDHMRRVVEQGDLYPGRQQRSDGGSATHPVGRAAFYSKRILRSTPALCVEATFGRCCDNVRQALCQPPIPASLTASPVCT